MQRLTTPLELKRASVDSETGTFSGYASTWLGAPDAYGDIVAPGAFGASLKQRKPAMLWAHDQASPVGRWTKTVEDDTGLRVEGRLTLEVEKAREALALMKSGAALGLSIGYAVNSRDGFAIRDDGVRELREVELFEVSIVPVPANASALISEVKGLQSAADFEKALKRSGLPGRMAKKLAAGGWPALSDRDDPGPHYDRLTRAIERRTLELKARKHR